MNIKVRNWNDVSREKQDRIMNRSETDILEVISDVTEIVKNVRERGDDAVREYTRKFDGVDLSGKSLRVEDISYRRAEGQLSGEVKKAIEFSIENVYTFHLHQKPFGMTMQQILPGVLAGDLPLPIASAGLYVPRGRGSFPSMLYMLAVPAKIAEVDRICIVTPPGPEGEVDPACLYAAHLCGIDEVYRIGGAHAVAALAFGTESIPRVEKITGPGSAFVSAAKRILYGTVDVGLPAGPSESVIIADGEADPETCALDLLTEAEHGSDSAAVLVTWDPTLAESVAEILPGKIEELPEPRKTFVTEVFDSYGGIYLTAGRDEAIDFANRFAPEHLLIHTADPFQILPDIKNAGEILLGSNVPFSSANYSVGPNAVLPTGGKAKTYSPVSVRDFIKYSSVIHMTQHGLEQVGPKAAVLAEYEGFAAHAAALKNRTNGK
ncbi:MAG: histidinol dehydrogenase [Spirochaetia bacterium]